MDEVINELREQRAILATIQARVFELETDEEKEARVGAELSARSAEWRRQKRIRDRMNCVNNLTQEKSTSPLGATAVQQWSDIAKEVHKNTTAMVEMLAKMGGTTVPAETD